MSSQSTTACVLVLPGMYYIAHIAIGAVYLGQCPRQPYIPVYLVVLGCFCLLQNVLACCLRRDYIIYTIWTSVTGLFILCWIITGHVWIYSIYEPNYDKTLMLGTNSTNSTNSTLDQYCDKTVYQFAFWTSTLTYILLALCLLGYGCFCLLGLVCHDDGDQGDPDAAAGTTGAEGAAAAPPPGAATPPHEEGAVV